MLSENVALPFVISVTATRIVGMLVGAYAVHLGADLFKSGIMRKSESSATGEFAGWKFAVRVAAPGSFFAVLGVVVIAVSMLAQRSYDRTAGAPSGALSTTVIPAFAEENTEKADSSGVTLTRAEYERLLGGREREVVLPLIVPGPEPVPAGAAFAPAPRTNARERIQMVPALPVP